MNLSDLRQRVLSANTSATEKAAALLTEEEVNCLDVHEWRELITGIPQEVQQDLIVLMQAGHHLRHSASISYLKLQRDGCSSLTFACTSLCVPHI